MTPVAPTGQGQSARCDIKCLFVCKDFDYFCWGLYEFPKAYFNLILQMFYYN